MSAATLIIVLYTVAAANSWQRDTLHVQHDEEWIQQVAKKKEAENKSQGRDGVHRELRERQRSY